MDTTALLWLISLLISIASVLVFLFLSYRHRQRIQHLQMQVREQAPRLVDAFLQRELQSMRHRVRNAVTDETAPMLPKLRASWLEAEIDALIERGRRHSDYAIIERKTRPLLRLLMPAAKAAKWDSKNALDKLQQARAVIDSQSDAIARFRKQVAVAPPVSHTLANVDKNNTELLNTIARLERELADLQQRFHTASEDLRPSIAPSKNAQKPHDIYVAISTIPDAQKRDATRELLAEIEQAYQQGMAEMNRLRGLNAEQRALVLQLEQELVQLRGNEEQHQASAALLEKMKLQLRDYDTCTVILEMETDALRERIEILNHSLSAESKETITTPLIAAPPVPEHIHDEKSLALLNELVALNGADKVASHLAVYLREAQLVATLFIKLGNEEAWVSTEGVIDTHDRQLLKSIVPTPGKPHIDVEEGVILLYAHCGVLLHANNRSLPHFAQSMATMQMLMNVLSHWLMLMNHEPAMPSTAGGLHNRVTNLLTQHNYVTSEHTRINEQLRSELDTIFNAAALTPVQRQMVQTMLEDFDAQLQIIAKAGKLIYTELKATLTEIEEPVATK